MRGVKSQRFLLIIATTSLLGVCLFTSLSEADQLKEFSVELGEDFRIAKGERAEVRETGFQLQILNFFNSPCPPNVKCFWSGVGIDFEYRHEGLTMKGVNLVEAFGYKVTVIASDYESYAVLKITRDPNG